MRVLGLYARDKKLLPLETAVHKMTALPAQRLGLTDRGVLRPGLKADIAVFDPARVRDTATFEQPHSYADGVPYVIVNGEVIVDQGKITGARPGRETRMSFTITKDGEPVRTDPYLGAGGHLVALREGDLAFLHVHPEASDDPGTIRFGATLPSAGRYRLFLQFKHDGVVRTVAHTLVVPR